MTTGSGSDIRVNVGGGLSIVTPLNQPAESIPTQTVTPLSPDEQTAASILPLMKVHNLGTGIPLYQGKTYDGIDLNFRSLTGLNGITITNDNGNVYITGPQILGTGTITSITAGTGLIGGNITRSGTISLANTPVIAGSYVAANITIDQQGRITDASSGDATYLHLAGGVMTGRVVLSDDPQLAFHAATKKYVDVGNAAVFAALSTEITTRSTAIAATLPLSGGTMTGPITLPADPGSPLQAATKQYVDSLQNTFLPKSGGTLTGALVLPADPSAPLQAATKQYVDYVIGGGGSAGYLRLSGGTLTGALTLPANPSQPGHASNKSYVDSQDATLLARTGGTLSGPLTLPANPSQPLQAAPKQYVDAGDATNASAITSVQTTANAALARSGGTMTGPIVLAADPGAPLQPATKQYVDSSVAVTTNYLPLAGGTMTGLLTLSANPTLVLHAATKQYVDAGDAATLPLAGGTLTGALVLPADPGAPLQASTKQYVDNTVSPVRTTANAALSRAGGTMTGPIVLPADPGAPLQAATKQYVDNSVVTGGSVYLPIAGGTLTGPLILKANPTQPLEASTKLYVDGQVATLLPKTGGTMTGAILLPSGTPSVSTQATHKAYVDASVATVQTTASAALSKSGGTMTGPIVLAADPGAPLQAATKQYVDNAVLTGSGYLSLSGGTLSGALVLPADPTTPLQASTKQYVDSAVSGAGYLPLAGGSLTGPLNLPANPTNPLQAATKLYVDGIASGLFSKAGGGLNGQITLPFDPSQPLQAATKQYVDAGDATVQTIANAAVPKAGGTMTGFLTLSADPSQPLHSATKQYVDTAIASGTGYLPLAGGTLTGPLTLPANPSQPLQASTKLYVDNQLASYVAKTGDSITGNLAVSGLFTVGASSPYTMLLTAKKNLMLGVTEPVNISSSGASGGVLNAWYTIANNYMSFTYWDGTNQRRLDGTNVPMQIAATGGMWSFQAGTTGVANTTVALTNAMTLTSGGQLQTTGNILAGTGLYISYSTVTNWAFGRNATSSYRYHSWRTDGWSDLWYESNGTRTWNSPSNQLMSLDSAGSLSPIGNVFVGQNLYLSTSNGAGTSWAFYRDVNNRLRVHQWSPQWSDYWSELSGQRTWTGATGSLMWLDGGGSLNTKTHVYVGNTLVISSGQVGDFTMYRGYPWRWLTWGSNWNNGWNEQTGQRIWTGPSNWLMSLDGGGSLWMLGNCTVSGTLNAGGVSCSGNVDSQWIIARQNGISYTRWGAPNYIGFSWNGATCDIYVDATWVGNTSDERVKTITGNYAGGLAEVLKINPITFRYLDNEKPKGSTLTIRDTTIEHIGVNAQDAEKVIPEMVTKNKGNINGEEVTDLRAVDTSPLIYAMVTAIKELNARIVELEAK